MPSSEKRSRFVTQWPSRAIIGKNLLGGWSSLLPRYLNECPKIYIILDLTPFSPGRLYDVPVQLGWLLAPLHEDELNPISMFL
ncbi:hypothetical protein C2W62_31920 [Candidatus Entotheonella serta]|nr:hypothetical protein C2W62_31920 [Candidatus Entotheonella serta]